MTFFKFALLALFIISALAQSQARLPVSNCLDNCFGCKFTDPLNCLPVFDNQTGKTIQCVPYYTGGNCTTGGSFYNTYKESGALNNFVNWSQPSQPATSQCESLIANGTPIAGIGPFSSTLNATKLVQFSPAQGVRRMLIKIGVGVSDPQLGQAPPNQTSTNNVKFVQINGTLYKVSTNTTQNKTLRIIPFLNLEIRDLLFSNSIVVTQNSGYQLPSTVETRCGFIYQFQFIVEALAGSTFQQNMLNFYLPPSSTTLWWLFDFRVEIGCSGFSVGVNCDSCLTGFYPVFTSSGTPDGCQQCDSTCATCGNNGVCLSCENYATQNTVTGACSFPSSYTIYSSSSSYQIVGGSSVNTTSSFFSQVYRSQNRQMTLKFTLKNTQSYLMKFQFLFPSSYVDNNAQLTVTIDGQVWNITNLNKNRGTFTDINGGTTQLYTLPYKIDRMGTAVQGSSQMTIQLQGTTIVDEFYLADPVIVQYQCSQNCLDCSFSLTQTVSCRRCEAFFDRQKNCLTCANGFFLLHGQTNRCVKCFSNCKQCHGPGSYQCIECFNRFGLIDYSFHTRCIQSIVNQFKKVARNVSCANRPTLSEVVADKNCSVCLSTQIGAVYRDPSCLQCWVNMGYAWGRCGALASGGLTFYGSQAIHGEGKLGWTGPPDLVSYDCPTDYLGLAGVPNTANNTNNTVQSPTTIQTQMKNLPPHSGLYFVIDIFKIDSWAVPTPTTNNTNSLTRRTPLTLTISVVFLNSVNQRVTLNTYNVNLNNNFGGNICGGPANDMIWTLPVDIADHSASNLIISISAPDKGIFVRDLEVYLGNCQTCSLVGLTYELFLIPVYSGEEKKQTGINSYITFNKPVFINNSNHQIQAFAQSFRYQINGIPTSTNSSLTYFDSLNKTDYRYIRHFLPLNQSYTNASVKTTTTQPDMIYSQDSAIRRQLVTTSQSAQLERYIYASSDTRRSIRQLSDFFTAFTWIAIIAMIVAVGLGTGIVVEEFSQMMQIIFLHIYITSWLLPPTIKVPLSHADRMEDLNFFGNRIGVEQSLFGRTPKLVSNYIFQQYNVDVYFLRSFYPILIINAIFIVWFAIIALLGNTCFKRAPGKFARFLRSIYMRPLAYFDQIWRYQFLTVMWACFLQFTNFSSQNAGQTFNLVLCIAVFVVAILWPFVVTIYIYREHFTCNAKHFLFLYHDLMYLKTISLCNQPKSYLYIGIRAGRLFAYAIFIALFINNSIIGPVLLIFYNLIHGGIAFFLDIFQSGFYLLMRIIENILLIVAAILTLVIFGFADNSNMSHSAFENLGYGLSTVFILMVINGVIRVFYLTYKKINEWWVGNYDVGENGQVENHDGKLALPGEAPQSDRLDQK